jgi:hypothetical protein
MRECITPTAGKQGESGSSCAGLKFHDQQVKNAISFTLLYFHKTQHLVLIDEF